MKQQFNHFEKRPSDRVHEALLEYDKYLNNKESVDVTEMYDKLYEAIKEMERIETNKEINEKLSNANN